MNVNAETEWEFVTIFDDIKRQERECGRREGLERGRAEGLAKGREEGRKEGREEGRKEGREEGRLEAHREFLRLLLANCLGDSFDVVAERRVATGTAQQISTWIARALEAARIDDIFGS